MSSDRWKARAKGGVLRREFLGYAVRITKWAATVWAGAVAGDFLAQRREQATVTRHYVLKAETGHFRVIMGTANMQLGPMTVCAVGTVSNPPDVGDLSAHIA